MKSIDWPLLRSFLAVVEMESLSAAAARIGTTQPTLGRHVRALEAVLGVAPFAGSVRGLDLTEAPMGLVDDARAMREAAEALALKAEGRVQKVTRTVRVTASAIVANLLLPPVLAALREAGPSIQVELVASDLAQNLLRRDAYIALRMFDPMQNALIARKLGDTPLGLFAALNFLTRRGPIQTVEDMLAHVYVAFVIDVFARCIVGWWVSRKAHAAFVLDALEQALHERRPLQGGGLVHYSDRGSQYLALRYTERLAEAGVDPSVGSVGDSYDNALAETINSLFKAEVIHRRGRWRSFEAVEFATLEWVNWFNTRRLLEPIGNIPPAEAEARYYAQTEVQTLAV